MPHGVQDLDAIGYTLVGVAAALPCVVVPPLLTCKVGARLHAYTAHAAKHGRLHCSQHKVGIAFDSFT